VGLLVVAADRSRVAPVELGGGEGGNSSSLVVVIRGERKEEEKMKLLQVSLA